MAQIPYGSNDKVYLDALKTIRKSIKQGKHEISGSLSNPACVIVTDKDTWDTQYIPLEAWQKTDGNAFEYGQTSALIDAVSGEGLIIDSSPYLPDDEIEDMQQKGLALEAAAYWAGYKSI